MADLPVELITTTSPSRQVSLHLVVEDQQMIADLEAAPQGAERDALAMNALRIGLLALRQARGRIDADAVRAEGERLLESLAAALNRHKDLLNTQVEGTLSAYFDPQSGKFAERVNQLLRKDGDLESVLKRQVSGDASELAKTLASSVGQQSPLMKLLSPTDSEGLIKLLEAVLAGELVKQRERILGEFSLDRQDSALSRFLEKVGEKSGELGGDLKSQVAGVVSQLSLDNPESALHRLR